MCAANVRQGMRGTSTRSTTSPILQSSPTRAWVASTPHVVMFSPNPPEGMGRPICCSQNSWSSRG